MAPRRRLFAVRFDEDLYEGLSAVWERDAVQPSEQVRRAVRAYLEKKGVMKSAKPARSKRTGAAQTR